MSTDYMQCGHHGTCWDKKARECGYCVALHKVGDRTVLLDEAAGLIRAAYFSPQSRFETEGADDLIKRIQKELRS